MSTVQAKCVSQFMTTVFGRHLAMLLRKQWLQKVRNPVVSVCEYILPLFFVSIFALLYLAFSDSKFPVRGVQSYHGRAGTTSRASPGVSVQKLNRPRVAEACGAVAARAR